jgi:hypothetical protein
VFSLTLAAASSFSTREITAPRRRTSQLKPRPPIIHTYNLRSVRRRISNPISNIFLSRKLNIFNCSSNVNCAATLIMNTALAPFLGLTPSPEAAKQAEKLLVQSLERIESVWLKGDTKYLLGSPQPSIADLCLVCEIMQLEVCMFPVSVYAISSSLLHCCNT